MRGWKCVLEWKQQGEQVERICIKTWKKKADVHMIGHKTSNECATSMEKLETKRYKCEWTSSPQNIEIILKMQKKWS
jgi:hypothetical protein